MIRCHTSKSCIFLVYMILNEVMIACARFLINQETRLRSTGVLILSLTCLQTTIRAVCYCSYRNQLIYSLNREETLFSLFISLLFFFSPLISLIWTAFEPRILFTIIIRFILNNMLLSMAVLYKYKYVAIKRKMNRVKIKEIIKTETISVLAIRYITIWQRPPQQIRLCALRYGFNKINAQSKCLELMPFVLFFFKLRFESSKPATWLFCLTFRSHK
ncbi:hypothetical protein BDF20DRAFT_881650 [Mycotypha africana]|uniref:uncharacterized protein n=1 Tax=Mycotypha africana TaxID=64632 RepID=UPI0022FFC583|nr:uncharacterized protein BDF20DRAFT_881650 [Mycotypha africana]KAI8973306.1 hypothetical protein BDF20DRAFT_881650 [Mycotypha africana]